MEFDELVGRLGPKLKAISRKVRNRYSYCDEDDFYQEALLFLWEWFSGGEIHDKTDSYILQGCYFFLKNYVRKICKSVDVNSVSMNAPVGEGKDVTIEEGLPSYAYVREMRSVEIFLMLDETEEKFTPREKDVFYYQLEGYTTREIGKRIGVSHVMVVKTKGRIREKCGLLREELV